MIGTDIWDLGMRKAECSNGSNETGGDERGQVRGHLWIGKESRWFYDL